MIYIGFDIETTGASMQHHHVAAVGACAARMRDGSGVSGASGETLANALVPSIEAEFRVVLELPWHNTRDGAPVFERRCWDEFWNVPDDNGSTVYGYLKRLGDAHGRVAPAAGARALWDWLRHVCTEVAKPMEPVRLITDTVGYDAGWLNAFLARHLDDVALHHYHALEYVTGEYVAVRCVTDYYIGAIQRTPHSDSSGACDELMERMSAALGLPLAWPSAVSAVVHDHDPLNDALSMTLKAAYVSALRVEIILRPVPAVAAAAMPVDDGGDDSSS